MFRARPFAAALACAACLAAAASKPKLQAQAPERQKAVLGLLRDESGAAVADAEVTFVPDAEPDVPALRDVQVPEAAVIGRSSASGSFRIAADRPGLLLVTTASGLGAIVDRVWPERAVRVLLRPMAEVARSDHAPLELHAALLGDDRDRRHLPPLRGTAVRLPAGRYETWTITADGCAWTQLALLPGKEFALPLPETTTAFHCAAASRIAPAGFPHLLLAPPNNELRLHDIAAAAEFLVDDGTTHRRSTAAGLAATGGGTEGGAQVRITGAEAATVFVLQRSVRNDWQVLASVAATASGPVTLPPLPSPGDAFVVATATDRAAAVRAFGRRDAAELQLRPGRHVRCEVRSHTGEPLAEATVAFAASGDGPITAIAYTDSLGRATLGPIDGEGRVQIEAPRHLGTDVALAADDGATIAVRLESGLTLRGTVVLPDGAPASGVAVVLRDPRGRLMLRERTVASGHDGSFAFDVTVAPADADPAAEHHATVVSFDARLESCDCDGPAGPSVTAVIDGVRARWTVVADGTRWHVQGPTGRLDLVERSRFPRPDGDDVAGGQAAPMPGNVRVVAVTVGQQVERGQTLVVMEAMKMEHTIVAPQAATVSEVRCAVGDQVDNGQILVVLEPLEG